MMKTALQYFLLVVIPVLTVWALIRLGENTLSAPASVGGAWQAAVGGAGCGALSFGEAQPAFQVSQSGLYVTLTFNDEEQTTFSGTLAGLEIAAQSRAQGTLAATLDRAAHPDRLEGTLDIAACGESIPFAASRLPGTAAPGEGE
jgi:hypothetical protein